MTEQPLNKILLAAHDLFITYGIRSVTMSDIARKLGISKKTLYQYVPKKSDLVHQVVTFKIAKDENKITCISHKKQNAIEEMLDIGSHIYHSLEETNPTTIYDLQKYYPESWEIIEKHRNHAIAAVVCRNIEKGITEGIYRKDLHPQLITRFYLFKLHGFTEDSFTLSKKYSLKDAFIELFKYHIYGIATSKGANYLTENITKIKDYQYDSDM